MPFLFAVTLSAFALLFSSQLSARYSDSSYTSLSSLSSPLQCAEDDKKDGEKDKKEGDEEPDCD